MEYRHVVTSFLRYENKVLILKRSQKVGTMRGRWAGISGYLEAADEPVARALQEIQEETGLASRQLRLVCTGKVVEAPDLVRDDLRWLVHPFLFDIRLAQIRLDWEHDEYRWIQPAEIDGYDTVPSLKEAFLSVWH